MPTVREFLEKIKFADPVSYDEPLSLRTTFRIGCPADAVAEPRTREALAALLSAARDAGLPVFLLGGGANLLVGDGGIRGLVVATRGLAGLGRTAAGLRAEAGVPVTDAVKAAADAGLSGLEFAAGLPGSVGGAVYMNARCYEREFADLMIRVDYLDPLGNFGSLVPDKGEWAYKRTPFMPVGRLAGSVVLGAEFRLVPGDRESDPVPDARSGSGPGREGALRLSLRRQRLQERPPLRPAHGEDPGRAGLPGPHPGHRGGVEKAREHLRESRIRHRRGHAGPYRGGPQGSPGTVRVRAGDGGGYSR